MPLTFLLLSHLEWCAAAGVMGGIYMVYEIYSDIQKEKKSERLDRDIEELRRNRISRSRNRNNLGD